MEKTSSKQNIPATKGKASEFLCLICNNYLKDPVSCSECMDAHFCSKCVQDEFQKNPKCPSCKSNWTDKSIKKIPAFLKLYEREEVKCPNQRCSWTGSIPLYILHKEECQQKPIFCVFSNYGCSWSGILGEEEAHGEICTFKPFKKFFETFSMTQAELEELRQRHTKTEAELAEMKIKNSKNEQELKLLDEKQQKLLEKLNLIWDISDVEEKLMFKDLFSKIESTILPNAPKNYKVCQFFKDLPVVSFTLLFRASRDGFGAAAFHSKCDNKGPTLVLVKTKTGYYFGGYAAVDWDSSGGSYKSAPSSFLFSFNRQSKHTVFQNQENSIYCYSGCGPTFGGGNDIYIYTDCNNNSSSYSNLGHTYSPHPTTYGSNEAKNYLAGSYNFSVEDYEVFAIK